MFLAQHIEPLSWSVLASVNRQTSVYRTHMQDGWKWQDNMEGTVKIGESQEPPDNWEIAFDILKSERNQTNCVPTEVKATGLCINLIEGKGLFCRALWDIAPVPALGRVLSADLLQTNPLHLYTKSLRYDDELDSYGL